MSEAIPKSFALRRIHSLAGFWFLLFLVEHLVTNSQAALWMHESGRGFIRFVNFLHNLPYLVVIESVFIGIPILVHAVIGIQFALKAKMNSFSSDGTTPSLPKYGRNKAYSWQRISAYFLLFMLIFHVIKFRFYEYPKFVQVGQTNHYLVKISFDPGLYTVASRLNVQLYDAEIKTKMIQDLKENAVSSYAFNDTFSSNEEVLATTEQLNQQKQKFAQILNKFHLKDQAQLVADAQDFGTATILSVRDAFKNKVLAGFYTVFVVAAVFHGFNGLWTFCITWGLIFKKAAQMAMVSLTVSLMFLMGFLGLAAIWGTYFITLKT